MKSFVQEASYSRHDFIYFFSHPDLLLLHDQKRMFGVLQNDSLWETTVIHHKHFGVCHTYNPPGDSFTSDDLGIRYDFMPNI